MIKPDNFLQILELNYSFFINTHSLLYYLRTCPKLNSICGSK